MKEEKLLTVRDVASLLGTSEKMVLDLAEKGTLPAYKIGGVYLRFKPEQIEEFKKGFKPTLPHLDQSQGKNSFIDKANDFLYFNDFYIFSAVIIVLLLFIIIKG